MNRRQLLEQLALFTAGMSVACKREPKKPAAEDASAPASAPPSGHEHALLPPQRAVLAAAVARILPTDHEPGAAEADVIEYVDRELARPGFESLRQAVIAGVTALSRVSMRGAGRPFVELAADEQDRVLRETETGGERGQDFIFVLTVLTLEGFFGDPKWGGNKGGVGWQLAGYGPGSLAGGAHEHH